VLASGFSSKDFATLINGIEDTFLPEVSLSVCDPDHIGVRQLAQQSSLAAELKDVKTAFFASKQQS
jgi:hypothetical protein